MTADLLKCPNCNQYKISTIQYRVHPSGKRVSIFQSAEVKLGSPIAIGVGFIALSALLCIGLNEPQMWYSGYFLFLTFSFSLLIISGLFSSQRYKKLKKEFDHDCQICGYKWTTVEESAKTPRGDNLARSIKSPANPIAPFVDSPKGLVQAPLLELLSGNAPASVSILNSDFGIGRSSQNDYVVKDSKVSRVHARIREAQGAWFIQDQNSASGTFVNGKRVQAQRLNDGDAVRIGDTTFKFRA